LLFCFIVSPSVGNASACGNSFFGSVFLVEGTNDLFLLRNDGGTYDCLVLAIGFFDTGIFEKLKGVEWIG